MAHLVRTWIAVDLVEGLAEVVGQGLGGGDGLGSGLDLDGAVAAGGFHEFADGPASLVLDEAADGDLSLVTGLRSDDERCADLEWVQPWPWGLPVPAPGSDCKVAIDATALDYAVAVLVALTERHRTHIGDEPRHAAHRQAPRGLAGERS